LARGVRIQLIDFCQRLQHEARVEVIHEIARIDRVVPRPIRTRLPDKVDAAFWIVGVALSSANDAQVSKRPR
jgi:hypothetical protein